jgi:hypothetical protein
MFWPNSSAEKTPQTGLVQHPLFGTRRLTRRSTSRKSFFGWYEEITVHGSKSIWLMVDLPLWKIWFSWDYSSHWKNKKCPKPPTRLYSNPHQNPSTEVVWNHRCHQPIRLWRLVLAPAPVPHSTGAFGCGQSMPVFSFSNPRCIDDVEMV